MDLHHLVKMANEIGAFFETAGGHDEAVKAIATHLRNFWEPRMRHEIIAYAHEGGGDLHKSVREAVLSLETPHKVG